MSVDPIQTIDSLVRVDIEGVRDTFSHYAALSTATVILGCVLEIPEVAADIWQDHFSETLERRFKILASFGLLLVILGIAGELAFQQYEARCEDLLQTFNNTLLRDAEQRVSRAQQASETAYTSAVKSALAAATAQHAADGALLDASTLEAQLASTQKELEQQGPRYALFVGKARDNFRKTVRPFGRVAHT